MFDRDRWQEIWEVLSKNKLRSILTAFGIFWGIFMMIIMLASGRGLQNGVSQDFGDMATNSMFLWTQGTSIPYKGLPRGRYFSLRLDDVDAIYNNIPEAKLVCPRNQLGGWQGANNVIRGLRTGAFSVYADVPGYAEVELRNMSEGRFINEADLQERRKVCVIGEAVYDALYDPGEEVIGSYVQISGVYFQVIGLFKSVKSGEDALEETQMIHIPFTTFAQAFNRGDRVGWMALMSEDMVKVSEMQEKVLALLKERHNVHPNDERAFGSNNLEEEYERMNNLFTGIKALSFFVGILTLIAGVIGVSNIMLVIVKERTKEIGVRRALGATPWKVMGQIIQESVVLTSLAGIAGLVAGVWLMEGVGQALVQFNMDTGSFRDPEVKFGIVFISLIILIISGALAGLIPAHRAVKIRPVDALRTE